MTWTYKLVLILACFVASALHGCGGNDEGGPGTPLGMGGDTNEPGGSGGIGGAGASGATGGVPGAGGHSDGAVDPTCGDSIEAEGEECDDGNLQAGDGCSASCTVEIEVTYEVGDTGPAGGLVIHDAGEVTPAGWRYIEAAPEDLTIESDIYEMRWFHQPEYVEDWADQSIGAGKKNSQRIYGLANLNDYPAFAACKAFEVGGAGDWFIPSLDELRVMYQTVGGEMNVGNFSGARYWSSSLDWIEVGGNLYATDGVHVIDFSDGDETTYAKWGTEARVRPVRYFAP